MGRNTKGDSGWKWVSPSPSEYISSSVTEIGIKYVPASEATFDKLVYTRNITADQGTYSVSGKIDFSDLYPDYYYFLYYIKNGQTYSTTSKYVSRGGASQGALTVAQFKAQPDDPEAWYSVTGIIYRIENSTYGNLYLADETGLLAVYGVTKTKRTGSSNDQSFSSLGLKTGDYVTICGPKKTYNGVIEMDNGYFIAKKTALTSETSFTTFALEPTTTTTITLGTPTNIYVSADEHYISYEYTYVALTLYFGTSCLRIPIWFFDYHDPVTVIQQRTYRVKAENMMGSVWGSDVIDASDGYVAYLNHDSFTTYFAGSTTFGQSAPYYVTDGTMTVSQSGNNTRLQINFTTKNGSTIKGDLVVDLISKLQLTPNSN